MKRHNALLLALILLFTLMIPMSVSARGRTELSDDRGPSIRLSESASEAASTEWVEEFAKTLTGESGDSTIPTEVLEMAVSRLPDDIASLSPETAAALVKNEAVILDREIRRGVSSNRAAIESSRRIRVSVAEEKRKQSEGERPADGGPAFSESPDRGGLPGPPPDVGPPGAADGGRALERIRERTAPVQSPGGPPDRDDLPHDKGPPDREDDENLGGDPPSNDGPPSNDDTSPDSGDTPVDHPTDNPES